jgi:hypothetical protein
MRISHIEMTITLEDGQTVQGFIGPESDSRWGNDVMHLGAAVAPMEAMAAALHDEDLWIKEDEEEDEYHGECGQCEGTGTIEGGLGGDGDDEECPVCDGSGEL